MSEIEKRPEIAQPSVSTCIQFFYDDPRLLAARSNRISLRLLDHYSVRAGCDTNRNSYERRDLGRLVTVFSFVTPPSTKYPDNAELLVRCTSSLYDWQYDLGLADVTFERVELRTAVNDVWQPDFEELTVDARGIQNALHEARQFNPNDLAL